MTDPIADMLIRIKNAQMVSKEETIVPFSNIKYEIAKILEKKGFIKTAQKLGHKTEKIIKITLLYENDMPRITNVKRISKPGQRIYKTVNEIRPVRRGYGVGIISTSKGIMSTGQARRKNLGGEMIAEIW